MLDESYPIDRNAFRGVVDLVGHSSSYGKLKTSFVPRLRMTGMTGRNHAPAYSLYIGVTDWKSIKKREKIHRGQLIIISLIKTDNTVAR